MARLKNPVKTLRTTVFIRESARLAGVDCKGCQLEQFFEPEKIKPKESRPAQRTCKYDRYVNHTSNPSPDTVDLICKRLDYNYLNELYYSPMWTALKAGIQSKDYWTEFYKTLSLKIQSGVFKPSISQRKPERKRVHSTFPDMMMRSEDDDSLSCVIGLLRDEFVPKESSVFCSLEVALFNMLVWRFTTKRAFYESRHEIWEYVIKHIVNYDRHWFFCIKDLWDEPLDIIENRINEAGCSIVFAEDIGLVSSGDSYYKFLYWLWKGNTKQIALEMQEALKTNYSEYSVENSDDGLKWLIRKLNQYRPKSKQLTFQK